MMKRNKRTSNYEFDTFLLRFCDLLKNYMIVSGLYEIDANGKLKYVGKAK
jgi:hypothetical protein